MRLFKTGSLSAQRLDLVYDGLQVPECSTGGGLQLRLDIVGSAGSYPAPGSACSSYLVRSDATSILFDAGNGSLSNLYQVIDPAGLDAIVISHGHVDHFADLVGIYHYLKYANPPKNPIPLLGTKDVFDKLAYLLSPGDIDPGIFSTEVVNPDDHILVGKIALEFFRANHPVPTLVTRISDGQASMCYGADGDNCDGLASASENVDLLLGESTWVERDQSYPTGLHLDARSLAKLAKTANVQTLVITHVAYPGDKGKILKIARETFSGVSHLAEVGSTFYL